MFADMPARYKAILTLVLIAPVLTEIVSGNTPPHALLHPTVDAFLVAVYSLPLLLIRETSIRWRLRTAGVFLLGLAYGLLNEGLVAQTLIRYDHVPVSNFDHYLCVAGINFGWLALIVPWHALMAVLFPIALLGGWFPSCAESPWLGQKSFSVLAAVVMVGVIFLGLVRTPHLQMRAFLATLAALAAVAWLLGRKSLLASRDAPPKSPAFVLGGGIYLTLFLGTTILAAWKAPGEFYFAYIAVVLIAWGWIGRRYRFERLPYLAIVALGAYFIASLFNFLSGFRRHSVEGALCGAILSLSFLALWRFSRPKPLGPPLAQGPPSDAPAL